MNPPYLAGIASALLATSITFDGAVPVPVTGGHDEGPSGTDASVGVFRGIPFAAPPVGPLRW